MEMLPPGLLHVYDVIVELAYLILTMSIHTVPLPMIHIDSYSSHSDSTFYS